MFPNVSKYDSRIQLNISATFQAVIIVQLSSTDSFVHVLQAQGNQLKINDNMFHYLYSWEGFF
jgi:hypothetical protein